MRAVGPLDQIVAEEPGQRQGLAGEGREREIKDGHGTLSWQGEMEVYAWRYQQAGEA